MTSLLNYFFQLSVVGLRPTVRMPKARLSGKVVDNYLNIGLYEDRPRPIMQLLGGLALIAILGIPMTAPACNHYQLSR